MRLWKHVLFNVGFWTAFWQYFEFAWKLANNSIIRSPVWSGTFGPPFLHHGYVGFIVCYVGYMLLTLTDFQTLRAHLEIILRKSYDNRTTDVRQTYALSHICPKCGNRMQLVIWQFSSWAIPMRICKNCGAKFVIDYKERVLREMPEMWS